MTGLIDGDIIVYRALWATTEKHQGSSLLYDVHSDSLVPSLTGRTTLNPYDYVDAFIAGLRDVVQYDSEVLCFSDNKENFRKTLYDKYKSGRRVLTDKQRTTREAIREYLMKHYSYTLFKRLEADDAIGILSTKDTICLSLDKDLDQVPGEHYNWNHQVSYEVSETEAWQWFLIQTLAGDRVDGYTGIRGVGTVKARKYLEEHGWTWESVENLYVSKGLFIEDALLTARLAKILRHNEWNKDGKVKLWRGEWI